MPCRYIRDTILNSRRWNQCSCPARELYIRLLLIADDYGLYYGNVHSIKNQAFPRISTIREQDVERWLSELEGTTPPMIRRYEASGDVFLKIENFGQPIRSKPKFPLPPQNLQSESNCIQLKATENTCSQMPSLFENEFENESSLSLTTCAHAHEGGGKYPENVEDVIELARSIGEAMSYDEAETYFIERAKLDWKTCKGVKIQRVDFDLKAWCKKKQQERYDRKSKEPKKPEAYGVEAI